MQQAATPATAQMYARAQLGTLKLAVPAECVLQAVPRPTDMTAMPRAQGALDGLFLHRGALVPVVDLRKWMAPDAAVATALPQILMLRHGERVLGLAVDGVQGLMRVTAQEMLQVHRDDDPNEFFHTVAKADAGTALVPLLDVDRLMQRVQAWSASSTALQSGVAADANVGTQTAAPQASGSSKLAIVRCGTTLLGFDAHTVGEVLPMQPVQAVASGEPGFMGITRWRGNFVPVLHVLPLLGVAGEGVASQSRTVTAPLMIVLSLQGRHVAVPVDEVRVVRDVSPTGLQPHDAPPGAHAKVCTHTAALDANSRAYVIHSDILLDICPLTGLNLLGQTRETGVANKEVLATEAHIVFRAGRTFAAAMGPMQEIIAMPALVRPTEQGAGGSRIGETEWRGQALPLVDLRAATDQGVTQADAQTRVVVVQINQRYLGLVVEEVVALLPAHTGVFSQFAIRGNAEVQMLTVNNSGTQKSYAILDLGFLQNA